jgi:hypothetical protein
MANDFMNEVADKAKIAAEYAGKKVGVVVDITKLNLKLVDAKNNLEKSFVELGKLTFDTETNGTDNTDTIQTVCAEISGLKQKIKFLKAEIASATGKSVCKKCGKSNPESSKFCNSCGEVIGR